MPQQQLAIYVLNGYLPQADIDCICQGDLQNTVLAVYPIARGVLIHLTATTDWKVRKFCNNLPIAGGERVAY
jgi:hypothetical protein